MATKQTTRRTSKSAAPKSKAAPKSTGTKRTSKKPTDKPKGPGVIASIVELLNKATKTKPLTKDALLAQLVKRFPDRGADAMKQTINCQLPSRLVSEKGLKIQSNDKKPKGYWIA